MCSQDSLNSPSLKSISALLSYLHPGSPIFGVQNVRKPNLTLFTLVPLIRFLYQEGNFCTSDYNHNGFGLIKSNFTSSFYTKLKIVYISLI